MNLVPRLLQRVRTLLSRSPGPSYTTPTPDSGPHPAEGYPSSQAWAAVLAAARHRRAPHLWPAPYTQPTPQPLTPENTPLIGALVRAYVLTQDERTRLLTALAGEAR